MRYTYQSSGLHLLILCRPGKQPRERLKKEVQLCQQHLWPVDKKIAVKSISTDLYTYYIYNTDLNVFLGWTGVWIKLWNHLQPADPVHTYSCRLKTRFKLEGTLGLALFFPFSIKTSCVRSALPIIITWPSLTMGQQAVLLQCAGNCQWWQKSSRRSQNDTPEVKSYSNAPFHLCDNIWHMSAILRNSP